MNSGYALLVILCLGALYSIWINLKAIGNNPFRLLSVACTIALVFSAWRYITLMIYGDSPSYGQMVALRGFYYSTSIGLGITMVSAVWYAIPLYREKIKYPYYLGAFLPWFLFYLYILIKQPTRIMQGESFGYVLVLVKPFPTYLGLMQGSFVLIIILLCCIGLLRYKHIQIRVQMCVMIISQLMLAIDGLGYLKARHNSIPPFTLSEAFAFFAIYYIFSKPIKEIKGICKQ